MHQGAALRVGAGHWGIPERAADVDLVRLGRVHVGVVTLLAAAIDDDVLVVEAILDRREVGFDRGLAGRGDGAEPLRVARSHRGLGHVGDRAVAHRLGGRDRRCHRALLRGGAVGVAQARRRRRGAAVAALERLDDRRIRAARQAAVDVERCRFRLEPADVARCRGCSCGAGIADAVLLTQKQVWRGGAVADRVVARHAEVVQCRQLDLDRVRRARLQEVIVGLGRPGALDQGAGVGDFRAVAGDVEQRGRQAFERRAPLQDILRRRRGVRQGDVDMHVVACAERRLFGHDRDSHTIRPCLGANCHAQGCYADC